jgi:hypothetical protein
MGISIEDLAIQSETAATTKTSTTKADSEPVKETVVISEPSTVNLSSEDTAKQMRSLADAMFKEAKKLREEAEKLSPTKKKTKTEETSE